MRGFDDGCKDQAELT